MTQEHRTSSLPPCPNCEALAAENARLRARLDEIDKGHQIKGWTCLKNDCGAFNGEEKELRWECRCCGAARPA